MVIVRTAGLIITRAVGAANLRGVEPRRCLLTATRTALANRSIAAVPHAMLVSS